MFEFPSYTLFKLTALIEQTLAFILNIIPGV